jgi:hydrogenase maturation protein HypF
MAENGLSNKPVIGVAFDGTGLGSDNALWGGEFLVCDYKTSKRKAYLRGIPLLGGGAAIMQPWRLGAAWLYAAYPQRFLDLKIPFTQKIDKKVWWILKKMHDAGLNSVSSSSAGRMWDAAASIITNDHDVHAEAELAIKLEKMAQSVPADSGSYRLEIIRDKDSYIIDPVPLFRGIVEDIRKRTAAGQIAYRFHLSAALVIKKVCVILRREHNINRVALSGGVFQNSLLLRLASGLLYKEDFEVFTHKKISCNDSGVSLGQAVIAGIGS